MQFNDFASRYYWTRLNPLKCCGCFGHHFGSVVACFIWAVCIRAVREQAGGKTAHVYQPTGSQFLFCYLGFYEQKPYVVWGSGIEQKGQKPSIITALLTILAFYSYLSQVPLVIFGVVNLIFGCVSLAGFITVLTRVCLAG